MDRTFKPALSTIAVAAAFALTGCSGSTTRHLDPQNLAMTSSMAAAYDDGETQLFESYAPVNLPVRQPTQQDQATLKGAIGPFDHHPWVTTGDVRCQLTFTIANMDGKNDIKGDDGKGTHDVTLLVDPWNEFGRYVPGVTMVGDNAQPNLSGYDEVYTVPGLASGRSSRIQHTISFDDMDEIATDFATAINIFAKVMPTQATATMAGDDPRVGLVNHAFNLENHHGSDPLTDPYTPKVIPALVGFNLGLRTSEPANLVIEYAVEIVDENDNRLVEEGSHVATLQAPGRTYSLAGG
jgi:hypothetical protein